MHDFALEPEVVHSGGHRVTIPGSCSAAAATRAATELSTDRRRHLFDRLVCSHDEPVLPMELLQLKMFETSDARHAGVSPNDLRVAVASGELVRLKRGWYTANRLEWPADRHRLLTEIESRERLWAIPSHYSAALLFGLPVFRPDWSVIHLMRTEPGPAQNRAGVVIHKKVGEHAGPSVALAVAQTALFCPVSGLMAYDAALHSQQISPVDLDAVAKQLTGWTGCAHVGVVRRLGDRRRESPLESRTALTFDRWGMVIESQFAVPGTTFTADGRIRGTRLLVECDGEGKYPDQAAVLAEKARENEIRAHEWAMVRVTDDLLDRPKLLHARVLSALKAAHGFGTAAA